MKNEKNPDSNSMATSLSPPPSSMISSIVDELPACTFLIVGDQNVGKTSLYQAFGRQNRRQQRAHRQRSDSLTSTTTTSSSNPPTFPAHSLDNGDLSNVVKNVDDYFDFHAGEAAENLMKFRVYDSAHHHLQAHPIFARSEKIDVVVICFALDSLISLENVEVKWKPELEALCPKAVTILVGTKVDLRDEAARRRASKSEETEAADVQNTEPKAEEELDFEKMVTTDVGTQMAEDVAAAGYAECSAKTHKGVAEIFALAAQLAPVSRKRVDSMAQKAAAAQTQLTALPRLRKRHMVTRLGMGIKRKWYRAVFLVSTVSKWTRGKLNRLTSAISSMFVILTGIILGLFY